MKTELIKDDAAGTARAAEILKNGGIVAIPTETVYGLAANALNESAVKKIFVAKGRPQDNPLIVHISNTEMLKPLVKNVSEKAKSLVDTFWPGPLTVIFERTEVIPSSVSAGLDTVAVRYPANPVAAAIIEKCGFPLAAPSANLSGSPSPTTARHCVNDLDGKVDAIVMSSPSEVGLESTVIALNTDKPRLLRPGYITLEQLESVIGEVTVDKAVTEQPEDGKPVASPGMKYKHYAPKCNVVILDGDKESYINYVNSVSADGVFALCFSEDTGKLKVPSVCYGDAKSDKSQAAKLFTALRELDEKGAKVAYAHCPELKGVGLAVYNRLIRAAAFKIIKI